MFRFLPKDRSSGIVGAVQTKTISVWRSLKRASSFQQLETHEPTQTCESANKCARATQQPAINLLVSQQLAWQMLGMLRRMLR